MDTLFILIAALMLISLFLMIYLCLHIPHVFFGADNLIQGRSIIYSCIIAVFFYICPSLLGIYGVIEINAVLLFFYIPIVILIFYIVFAVYKQS